MRLPLLHAFSVGWTKRIWWKMNFFPECNAHVPCTCRVKRYINKHVLTSTFAVSINFRLPVLYFLCTLLLVEMTLTLADQKYDELEELFTTSLCQSWSSQKRRPAKQWVTKLTMDLAATRPVTFEYIHCLCPKVPEFGIKVPLLSIAGASKAIYSVGSPDIIHHNVLWYLLYGLGASYLVLTICIFPSQVFCLKAMGKSWKNQKDARLQRIADGFTSIAFCRKAPMKYLGAIRRWKFWALDHGTVKF